MKNRMTFLPLLVAAFFAGATTALAATRITTRAELAAITNNLAGAYELGCDIDLAGEPWTPIGNNFHKFTGSLDGCGHVISNLTVTADSSNYAGLFGYLGSSGTDARVTNLRIANATVSGRSYVGTLAGCAEDATVTNCSVVGATVMATGGTDYGRARPWLRQCRRLLRQVGAELQSHLRSLLRGGWRRRHDRQFARRRLRGHPVG